MQGTWYKLRIAMKRNICLIVLLLLCLTFLPAGIRRIKDRTSPPLQTLEAKGDSAFNEYFIEQACQYWEEAINENPNNLDTYNKLGICFLLLKENEKAVSIFEDGLKLNGRNADMSYNLALAQYYCGDFEEACRVLEKVISLNWCYPRANYLKGVCLENMGRIDEAEKAYVEELNNNPGSRAAWRKVKGL